MPHRIQEDQEMFRNTFSNKARKEIARLKKNGKLIKMRPKGGKITISIPQIEIPRFVHGEQSGGVGRGPVKEGDVIGKNPKQGKGEGGAGDEGQDGVIVQIDMEDIINFIAAELDLPPMLPKPNGVFEEVKIKYNNISKVGLNSLRHTRRTLKETLKRAAMSSDPESLAISGDDKEKIITPIKQDFRYRQYKEYKFPSTNAVVFFARDCSGSVSQRHCEIISDMAWWLDCWTRKFYKHVEKCYLVHDVVAKEVDEKTFYRYREGGGTICSSAFSAIAQKIEHRFPTDKYNIYVFYFTDGDNYHNDNEKLIKIIKENLGPDLVNFIGVTEVLPYTEGEENLKSILDRSMAGVKNYKSARITRESGDDAVFKAIKELLGKQGNHATRVS